MFSSTNGMFFVANSVFCQKHLSVKVKIHTFGFSQPHNPHKLWLYTTTKHRILHLAEMFGKVTHLLQTK